MSWAELLVVAVCLGMDAFSVALSVGYTGTGPRSTFRLSFHFGLFQFLMPVIGWVIGSQVSGWLAAVDHWIAFGILAAIGLNMLRGAIWGGDEGRPARDHSRGMTMIGLSVAVSIDALAVGVGMGLLQLELLRSALVIGVVAGLMTLMGIALSKRLSDRFGPGVEALGGLVLLGVAVKMLSM